MIYSIDPAGCTDADDAFEVNVDQDSYMIHLQIHVADPTRLFTPEDPLFHMMLEQGQTSYFLDAAPKHLMPSHILEQASLTHGTDKSVLTVHTWLDFSYNIVQPPTLSWQRINCKQPYHRRFTYEDAAATLMDDPTLQLTLAITDAWKKQRNASCVFDVTVPSIENGKVVLKADSCGVKAMKGMIAELAIHANKICAETLVEGARLVRACDTKHQLVAEISDILKYQLSAEYATAGTHDLLGGHLYTHATSPLRRFSDCIVHFMLKAQLQEQPCPFTAEQLQTWGARLTYVGKQHRRRQLNEQKRAILKWMHHNAPVDIEVRVISWHSPYVNLVVNKINQMPVHMSYALHIGHRSPKVKVDDMLRLKVTQVCWYMADDQGSLPELDQLILQ
jgi:exoribonuclease-2